MENILLEMKNMTKLFPGVKALDNVNLKVKKGEIHCLVGENGAGKSTLMNVLSGVYSSKSYSGKIIFDGEEMNFKDISDSRKCGISIIHQELALIDELSIYENIFFGHEIKKGKIIDFDKTILEAKKILRKVRLNVDPSLKVKNLGVGQQQLVEIAKALSQNVRLLILDEPTATLNEDDSKNLLDLLRKLKKQGVTCILISHKLQEVIEIADTITILRDGTSIISFDCHEKKISEADIIKHMVGREIGEIYPKRNSKIEDKVIFEIKNFCAFDKVRQTTILDNISLNVKKGEIVGIQGLVGAGRSELAYSIFGNVKNYKITSGEVILDNEKYMFKTPKDAIEAGLAYVSEDRKGDGLILIKDIKYNITYASLNQFVNKLAIDSNEEIVKSNEYKEKYNIKAPSLESCVMNLSGGNQQKVQLAKWMMQNPKLLILDEPTRGIDVGAKHEIYALMNRLVEDGMSIIMISSELPEILGMSDRIYVMAKGKIVGQLDKKEATKEKIMEMAVK